MSIVTDTGSFSAQVDFSMASTTASAATVNLGATNGNTVIITGTTTITSLGTAPQAGVKRSVKFNDALILTHGASLVLFGATNITTVAGDIAEFTAITTTQWEMTGWFRPTGYTGGQIDGDGLLNSSISSSKLGDGCVIPSKTRIKDITALADADATLTADQMLNGIFTITPTANRVLTTATGANIIGSLTGYQAGTSYELTIVNQAAFNATLTAGANVTIIGSAVVNNASATF